MLALMLILVSGEFKLEKQVSLATSGIMFDNLQEYCIQQNETLILCSRSTAYVFGMDGSLINTFGSPGNGPGEFIKIFGAYSSEDYILLQDSRRNDINFFDHQGHFMKRVAPRKRNFYFLKNMAITYDSDALYKSEPPLFLFKLNENFDFERSGEPFHFVRPEIGLFEFNFSNFTICEANGMLYIMDQLRPEVSVYNESLKKVDKFNVTLPNFEVMKKLWPSSYSLKEIGRYIRRFSLVHRIGALENGLAISYTTPNAKDPDDRLTYVSVVSFEGKSISKAPLFADEMFLGTLDDAIVIISSDDNLNYTLKFFKYAP